MRKVLMAFGFLTTVYTAYILAPSITPAQQESPAYAKWGQLAVKETSAKYPQANIIDYLHIGSESKNESTVEKFKLWLKEGNHEFGVFVNITFITKTEEVITIELKETPK
ncbi:hypothetical protein SLU01_20720 [Sporosarcina luteola]|uniref:DUF3889 domain-containing protein n=1 Tax=Sporosarcina luteola TaxID=582850 RepID=A0A511Z8J1_9BACL|nr:DUF3889 domain-containing protein [Sporosarcina luteola]GEN83760.1 hypothetical protein SLU01_20720 [Sporosarcina luteola]